MSWWVSEMWVSWEFLNKWLGKWEEVGHWISERMYWMIGWWVGQMMCEWIVGGCANKWWVNGLALSEWLIGLLSELTCVPHSANWMATRSFCESVVCFWCWWNVRDCEHWVKRVYTTLCWRYFGSEPSDWPFIEDNTPIDICCIVPYRYFGVHYR